MPLGLVAPLVSAITKPQAVPGAPEGPTRLVVVAPPVSPAVLAAEAAVAVRMVSLEDCFRVPGRPEAWGAPVEQPPGQGAAEAVVRAAMAQ